MKIIALALFALVASANFLQENIATLDLRDIENELPDEPYTMKVESGSFFKVVLYTNPSTGFYWQPVSNTRANCLCKVRLIDQNMISLDEDKPMMGSQKVIELYYLAELIGKQDLVLVYSRSKPEPLRYDEYAKNSRNTKRIQITIGENDDFDPCQS